MAEGAISVEFPSTVWEVDLIQALAAHLSSCPARRDAIARLRQRFAAYKQDWQATYKSFAGFVAAHSDVFHVRGDSVELVTVASDAHTASHSAISAPSSSAPQLETASPLLGAVAESTASSNVLETRAHLFAMRDRLKNRESMPSVPDQHVVELNPALPRRAKSGPVDLHEFRDATAKVAHVPSHQRPHRRSASSDKEAPSTSPPASQRVVDDWEVDLIGTLVDYLTTMAPKGSEDIHVLTAKYGHKYRVAIYHKYRKFRVFLQAYPETFEIDSRDQVFISTDNSPRQGKPSKPQPLFPASTQLSKIPTASIASSASGIGGSASWEVALVQGIVKMLHNSSMEWNTLATAFPQYRSHIKYSYGSFKAFLVHHHQVFRVQGEHVSVISHNHPPSSTPLWGATLPDDSTKSTLPRLSPSLVTPLPIASLQKPSPPASIPTSPRTASGPSLFKGASSAPSTAPIAIPANKRGRRDSVASSHDSDADTSRTSGSEAEHDEEGHSAPEAEAYGEGLDINEAVFQQTSDSDLHFDQDGSSVLSSTPTSSTTFGLSSMEDAAQPPVDAPPPVAPAYRPKFRPALRAPGTPSTKKTAQFALPSKPVMPSFTFFPRPETKLKVRYIDNITTAIFAINDLLQFNRLAVGCQGVKGSVVGRLSLVVMTARDSTLPRRSIYLFDVARCVELSKYLRIIFEDEKILKVFHNSRQDVAALSKQQAISVSSIVDTKVLFRMFLELLTLSGNTEHTKLSLITLIARYNQPANPHREQVRLAVNSEIPDGPGYWHQALTKEMIEYAAYEVAFLLDIHSLLSADLVTAVGQSVMALSKRHAYADILKDECPPRNIVEAVSSPIPTSASWFRDFWSHGLDAVPEDSASPAPRARQDQSFV